MSFIVCMGKMYQQLSPLEQFEVFPLVILEAFNGFLDFSLTNFSLFLLVVSSIVCTGIWLAVYRMKLLPTRIRLLVEAIREFVLDTLVQQAGHGGVRYMVYYFVVSGFILVSNLVGLLPFCFTVTSHLIMVSFLALLSNLAFIFIGFNRHGLSFLKLFVPSSAPLLLVPLITVIEIASYLIRTLSLSLRLFANMMAGHILLYILASFVLRLLNAGAIIVSFVPLVLMIAVFALELGICFIQAYVSSVLLSIYLSESLATPGH